MSASLQDVAARAHVSAATASRALRGLPHVSAQTRQRVERAAKDLDYPSQRHGSGLAQGRTGCVGVVVPMLGTWYFSELLAGLQSVFHQRGRDVLLYCLGDDAGRRRFFDVLPMRQRVEGIVVLNVPVTQGEAEALASLYLPAVLLGADARSLPSIRIDDVDGARTAVRHLINLGHRRIGFITGREVPRMHFTAPADRRVGYRAALREHGVEPVQELEVTADFCVDGGAAAMAALLSLPVPPTAVFVESDEMAMGALRTVRRMGLRVPDDVSVVGFDDHELAELMDLTTVAQPVRRQGAIAARMLVDLLDGDEAISRKITVPTQLVVRGTTGPVRGNVPTSA